MSGCWSHVVATNPIFMNAALEPSNIASFCYFSTEAVSSSSCMQQAGGDLKQQRAISTPTPTHKAQSGLLNWFSVRDMMRLDDTSEKYCLLVRAPTGISDQVRYN